MNGSENISEIFRSLELDLFIQLAVVFIGASLLIVVSMRFLPWIADKVPGRFRFFLLASVPGFRLLIIIGAVTMIITRLIEPTFENMVALAGALGLALGFAFKDYTSSLIAGVVTLYETPYRPGDWIEIDGAYGEVKAINMRSAEIVTPDDSVVFIPHQKIWDHLISNANDGGRKLQCAADFYLHPRHDAARVKHLLHDVALTSPFLQMRQPISVIVTEKPWGTRYRLRAYPIDPRQQFQFITDLTIRGKTALIDLGVEFGSAPYIQDNFS